ncbi:hypothetical protein EVAR_15705_1 [Eumeta japonica]|uniref:Uncharacterized protein n=1 Tax=Eumeta variegata TaxID=151549 RepID=A0A4C1U9I8_EUMVA|nr:hypothetical protein EVAR_15705_1 [Eumeta japonica]
MISITRTCSQRNERARGQCGRGAARGARRALFAKYCERLILYGVLDSSAAFDGRTGVVFVGKRVTGYAITFWELFEASGTRRRIREYFKRIDVLHKNHVIIP